MSSKNKRELKRLVDLAGDDSDVAALGKFHTSALVGFVRFSTSTTDSDSVWYNGGSDIGWVVDRAIKLPDDNVVHNVVGRQTLFWRASKHPKAKELLKAFQWLERQPMYA